MKTKPEVFRHWIAEWAVTLLILLFGTTTALQAFIVPTGSMENTVLVGDMVLVDKLAYAPGSHISKKVLPYQEVKRGDIIVFRYPLNIRENYVKRVIGVPGDRIRFENKELILNGRKIVEPYRALIPEQRSKYLNDFPQAPDIFIEQRALIMLNDHVRKGELIVPEGQYFAMGDNRDNSADSRFWGLVPRENIIGKPTLIVWSYDAPTSQLANGHLNLDHIADVALNFFSKTRWRRTFLLVRGYPL